MLYKSRPKYLHLRLLLSCLYRILSSLRVKSFKKMIAARSLDNAVSAESINPHLCSICSMSFVFFLSIKPSLYAFKWVNLNHIRFLKYILAISVCVLLSRVLKVFYHLCVFLRAKILYKIKTRVSFTLYASYTSNILISFER